MIWAGFTAKMLRFFLCGRISQSARLDFIAFFDSRKVAKALSLVFWIGFPLKQYLLRPNFF
jgi:hypothetical protein